MSCDVALIGAARTYLGLSLRSASLVAAVLHVRSSWHFSFA
jgi:hypothetical protein